MATSYQIERQGAWSTVMLSWLYRSLAYLPMWRSYIQSLAVMVQAAEDESFLLIADCTLAASTGAQLEQWGALLNVPRNGLDDTTYRWQIMAATLVRDCDGTVDKLETVFATVCGVDVSAVALFQTPPASYELTATMAELPTGPLASAIIRSMAAANATGIGQTLVVSEVGYFGWDEDPDALGFDEGEFASVLE